jgi:hypothetical protein
MARNRHGAMSAPSPLWELKRNSDFWIGCLDDLILDAFVFHQTNKRLSRGRVDRLISLWLVPRIFPGGEAPEQAEIVKGGLRELGKEMLKQFEWWAGLAYLLGELGQKVHDWLSLPLPWGQIFFVTNR